MEAPDVKDHAPGPSCPYPKCPSGVRQSTLREALEEMKATSLATLTELKAAQLASHNELKNGQEKLFELLSNQKVVMSTLVQHAKNIDELKSQNDMTHNKLFDLIRDIEKETKTFVTKDDVTKIMGIFTGIVTLLFIGIEIFTRVVWPSH